MNTQPEDTSTVPKSQLTLHRLYVKSSLFESFALTVNSFKNPVQPVFEMQVFAVRHVAH